MVDQISGGRVEVGFGLGHRVEELVALGVAPEQRIRIFQERIALVQALTQIQEITLTFVPKIVAIMLVVALTGPFIGSQISAFTNVVFERIEHGF